MKRLLSSLILVLVLVPLMLLMRWGGEAKAPWSAPLDDVQARLVAPRFVWRADDSVVIALRLRNRSDQDRAVSAVSVRLRVAREGRAVAEESLVLASATVPARGEIDLPLRSGRLDTGGPGLYTVDGELEGLGLMPLKLRIVKARSPDVTPVTRSRDG